MLTSAERLVRTLSSFTNSAESVVDLLTAFIRIHCKSLCSNTLGIVPAVWVPTIGILPDCGVGLADSRGSQDVVSFRDNVDSVLRGSREGCRDWDIVADISHDAVDGRMHTEGLPDDRVEKRKSAEFLICEGTHLAIRTNKVFDLFLIQCLTIDETISVKKL